MESIASFLSYYRGIKKIIWINNKLGFKQKKKKKCDLKFCSNSNENSFGHKRVLNSNYYSWK